MKKLILLSILSAFLGVFTYTNAYCQYNEYGGIQDAIDFAQQNDIAYSVDGVSHNGFFDGDLSSVSYKGGQAGYYNFDNQIQKGYFYFRNKNSPPKFYQGPRDRWLNVKLSAYEFVPFKNQDAVKTAISLNNLKQQEEQLNSTPQSFENFSKSADYFINTYERERQEVIQGQIGSNECGQDCGRPDSFELNDNKSDTKFTLVSTFKNKINNEFNDIVDIFKAGSRDGSAEGALFGPIKDSNKYISDLIDKDDDDEKDESCYAGVCTDITDNSKFEISFRFKSLLNANSDINIAGLAGIGDGGIEFLNFVAKTFVTINRQRTNSIILGELDPETRSIIEQQQQAKFKAKLDNIKDFIFYLSSPQFQLKKGPELLKESLNEVIRYVSGKPTVESEYKAGKFAFELLGLLFGSTEVKAALKSEAAFIRLLNRIPKGTTKKFSILDGSTNGRYILYKNDSRFPKLVNETEESFFLKAPHIITKGDEAAKTFLKVLEGKSFGVDNVFKAADEAAGVLVNGKYLKNPTAKNVKGMVRNPSGTLKLDAGSGIVNGQFMYVVDDAGELVIGTRAKGISPFNGKAPHPTLIGGSNPTVKAAGIVEFRGGKIFKVDNASGHFKPANSTLESAETIFKNNFGSNNFTNDFQGFVPFKK